MLIYILIACTFDFKVCVTREFNSKENCEQAGIHWKNMTPVAPGRYICVVK